MNKQKYLIRNVGILTISNFASKVLVFLLVPLYTSVLSTGEYGTADLLTSTISIFTPLLTLNIVDAVMRFTMDEKYEKQEVFLIGERYTFIGIAIVLFLLLMNHFCQFSHVIKKYEAFILGSYSLGTLNNLLTQFAKGLEKIKQMAIAGVIGTFSTVLLNILFLLVLNMGLKGYLLTMVVSALLQFIYLFFSIGVYKYQKISKISAKYKTEMLMYCVPLLATTIGWWINSASDKYVVTFFLGMSANGILSVAYKIPQIINTLQSIFSQAWQISAIKEYGEEDTAVFYGKTFSTINLLMVFVCSALIILTRPMAYILYAKEFYNAWKYVPFLLISSVFNSASGLLGPILAAKKDSKAMMRSAIVGAGANIILNILLVYFIGIQGATIATMVCSYIIYSVRRNAVGTDIKIFGYSCIWITWVMLVVQAMVEIYLKVYWIELLIIFGILILNYKYIKVLLNQILKLIKLR